MIRRSGDDSEAVHTDFLCAFSEGLSRGKVPCEELRSMLSGCSAEDQQALLDDAKVVLLLDEMWRSEPVAVNEHAAELAVQATSIGRVRTRRDKVDSTWPIRRARLQVPVRNGRVEL